MAKGKSTAYFCSDCGYESAKWTGQCPACKSWNTMVEEPVSQIKTVGKGGTGFFCRFAVIWRDRTRKYFTYRERNP